MYRGWVGEINKLNDGPTFYFSKERRIHFVFKKELLL